MTDGSGIPLPVLTCKAGNREDVGSVWLRGTALTRVGKRTGGRRLKTALPGKQGAKSPLSRSPPVVTHSRS
jgi:hypothetical protein